jgi:hypothetical protein
MRLKTGKDVAGVMDTIRLAALSDMNNPHLALRATLPEDGEG